MLGIGINDLLNKVLGDRVCEGHVVHHSFEEAESCKAAKRIQCLVFFVFELNDWEVASLINHINPDGIDLILPEVIVYLVDIRGGPRVVERIVLVLIVLTHVIILVLWVEPTVTILLEYFLVLYVWVAEH